MLNRLFQLFGSDKVELTPQVLSASDHDVPRDRISHNALKVVDRLQSVGFSAYIVGGGVRDLLLGGRPKDFDVATNATPEQITKLFRNGRIIGKRFRIVHVRFGREIIEVTTFRAHHDSANHNQQSAQSEHGLLLRDNVWGDIESDAIRRDFTVNALYYDPQSEEVYDFVGGLRDLNDRVLRIIGNARDRYTEDPVRMLRAIRFSAKLGFELGDKTEAPITELGELLSHVPTARRFEEVLKLFMYGSATATLNLLRQYDLLQYLFPGTDARLKAGSDYDEELVNQATANTDGRIRQDKRVTPAFIYAAFLWPSLNVAMNQYSREQNMSPFDAMQLAAQGVVSEQLAATALPKRFMVPMREIWSLQLRLPKRGGRRAFQTLDHPRFRAAYDFLLLREQAGEDLGGLGMWWTRFQDADDNERQAMLKEVGGGGGGRRGGRKPRRRRSTSGDSD